MTKLLSAIDRVASGFSRKNDASCQLPPEGGSHEGVEPREHRASTQIGAEAAKELSVEEREKAAYNPTAARCIEAEARVNRFRATSAPFSVHGAMAISVRSPS